MKRPAAALCAETQPAKTAPAELAHDHDDPDDDNDEEAIKENAESELSDLDEHTVDPDDSPPEVAKKPATKRPKMVHTPDPEPQPVDSEHEATDPLDHEAQQFLDFQGQPPPFLDRLLRAAQRSIRVERRGGVGDRRGRMESCPREGTFPSDLGRSAPNRGRKICAGAGRAAPNGGHNYAHHPVQTRFMLGCMPAPTPARSSCRSRCGHATLGAGRI